MALNTVKVFLRNESFAGFLLMLMAIFALGWRNSPWYASYHLFFAMPILHQSLNYWINHGLMAVFFLLVGLEIKRELLIGELNSLKKAMLPGIAALGGMLLPVTIFILVNSKHPEARAAWGVPVATDIAFSLAVLRLLGRHVPFALKLFLITLATFDDLGAVAIIAVFYTQKIHALMLSFAVMCFLLLCLLNFFRVRYLSLYLALGVLLWIFVAQAGIDAAISGVLIAITIPLQIGKENLLSQLENDLHGAVTFLVLPLFALANAGVRFSALQWSDIIHPLPLGIMAGLVIGKPLGVTLFSYFAVKLKMAKLPEQVGWRHIAGVAMLCGIGFTMSLLIGELAFTEVVVLTASQIKLAVLLGSLIAGILGYSWLRFKHERT